MPNFCPSIYFYVFIRQYVLMLMVQPQLLLTFDLPVILIYFMIYYQVQIVGLFDSVNHDCDYWLILACVCASVCF